MKEGVAALSHFPVILWIIGPLLAWPFAKDNDTKFQVKQAFVWQLLWLVVLGILWVVSLVTLQFNLLLGLAFKSVTYFLAIVALAYAIYASYKVLEGDKFRYPVIASMLSKH